MNSQSASHPILNVQGPQARAASGFPLLGAASGLSPPDSLAGRLSPLLLRVADKEDRPLCLLWPSLWRSRPPSGGPVSSGNRLSVCQDTITFLQPEATPGWVGVGWTVEEETGQLQASLFPGASAEKVHWGGFSVPSLLSAQQSLLANGMHSPCWAPYPACRVSTGGCAQPIAHGAACR